MPNDPTLDCLKRKLRPTHEADCSNIHHRHCFGKYEHYKTRKFKKNCLKNCANVCLDYSSSRLVYKRHAGPDLRLLSWLAIQDPQRIPKYSLTSTRLVIRVRHLTGLHQVSKFPRNSEVIAKPVSGESTHFSQVPPIGFRK